MEVPPGADPHDSRKGVIIGVTAFTLTVAFITVALRVYTRAVILRQFKLDDYTAVVAFLLIFACGFCVAYNTVNGLGTRVYFLDSATIERYLKTFYVSVIFYNASLMAVKMTFLFQYWRVLSLAVQRYRKVMIAATVIVFCWSVSQILLLMMVCIPIAAFWDRTVKEDHSARHLLSWLLNGFDIRRSPQIPEANRRFHLGQRRGRRMVNWRALLWHHLRLPRDITTPRHDCSLCIHCTDAQKVAMASTPRVGIRNFGRRQDTRNGTQSSTLQFPVQQEQK